MRTNRPKSRAGLTLVRLAVVISIVGVLVVGLLLPAVQEVRKAAHRSQFLNDLKQQAVAVASYVSAFSKGKGFPWSKPASPYLDHSGLSDGYGQAPAGTPLPWQSQNSPYLQH
jgi:type II secretory pathway pseudopilin PulG